MSLYKHLFWKLKKELIILLIYTKNKSIYIKKILNPIKNNKKFNEIGK